MSAPEGQPSQDAGGFRSGLQELAHSRASWLRRLLPGWAKHAASRLYWLGYDARDYLAEAVGWLPSHSLRMLCYRHLLARRRGPAHQHPPWLPPRLPRSRVEIGANTVINRDILLDGRMGLFVGDNVSVSRAWRSSPWSTIRIARTSTAAARRCASPTGPSSVPARSSCPA